MSAGSDFAEKGSKPLSSSNQERRLHIFISQRGTGKPIPGISVIAMGETKSGDKIPLGTSNFGSCWLSLIRL